MGKTFRLVLAALAICAAGVWIGVARADDSKPLKLAFVTNNASSYWDVAKAGCKKAEQEVPNVTVQVMIPSEQTAAEQQRILDNLVSAGYDGIAISPADPAHQTDTLNEVASHCLLITQDSDAPNSNRVCYLGTDNEAAGELCGQLINKALPDGGKIILFVGTMDAQNARDRVTGIKKTLNSNITIIDTRTDESDRDRAKANVEDTLAKYPDIGCLVGLYSYNGPIIATVLRDSGKKGVVKEVCFDYDQGVPEGIKDGTISAAVAQQPFEFGRQAVHFMADYLRGNNPTIPADKQIFIPTKAIDSSNVDQFVADLKAASGK
ncbi:MAG: sugar-binding protein [Tepidisphaeraceae bacterium]|jgi:ribose transport system substrate-binding protein